MTSQQLCWYTYKQTRGTILADCIDHWVKNSRPAWDQLKHDYNQKIDTQLLPVSSKDNYHYHSLNVPQNIKTWWFKENKWRMQQSVADDEPSKPCVVQNIKTPVKMKRQTFRQQRRISGANSVSRNKHGSIDLWVKEMLWRYITADLHGTVLHPQQISHIIPSHGESYLL